MGFFVSEIVNNTLTRHSRSGKHGRLGHVIEQQKFRYRTSIETKLKFFLIILLLLLLLLLLLMLLLLLLLLLVTMYNGLCFIGVILSRDTLLRLCFTMRLILVEPKIFN